MNLVYGSSSSSYMDCKVFFGDECFSFRRSGVRLDQCSCIGAFVAGLIIFGNYVYGFIFGNYDYGSTPYRMSTRRLPVILCISFRVSIISCCLLRGVPMVAEGEIYFVCVQWHVGIIRLFHSLLLIIPLPLPPWAHRQPHRSRLC